ncbi:MAG: hypothetical protein FWG27_03615 [Treponema sp.]|nr:hypothetical protein [Treponema sp.]
MNIGSIKTRLKKLEPKEKADSYFGSLHEHDPHTFPPGRGSYRVHGRVSGLSMTFDSGYFDTFEEGMETLKKALRKYTIELCDIIHVETKDGNFILNTYYELDKWNVRNKYPEGINEVIPPCYKFGPGTTDIEWLSTCQSL